MLNNGCYVEESAASANIAEKPQVKAHMAPYFLFVTAVTDRPSMAGCSQIIQILMTCWFETVSGKARA